MEVIEIRRRIDCNGCERKVRRAISKLKGVEYVEIDKKAGKVTVVGYFDKMNALKMVQRVGKSAELEMPTSIVGYNPYLDELQMFENTYIYKGHGCNAIPSNIVSPSFLVPRDAPTSILNDDNAHYCSIM